MNEPTRVEPIAALSYRCVCGESFDIQVGDVDARCPNCGRHYAPEALQGNAAETLSIGHEDAVNLRGVKISGGNKDLEEVDGRIGKQYDHFRIVEVLGQGGMGAVYKALDESLQRYVALKVVNAATGSSAGDTRSDRIVEEARAQARVSHPNVVHIYYVGREEASPFFAMELVAGPPLSELLDKGPLEFDAIINVALQVVDALAQSAAFDIVHGDIKPSNILIAGKDKQGRTLVKLSDFGLAQRLSRSDEQSGSITGTPDYLSPEAARGQPLVQQSDMYSLGVTLFQLTFGRLPYTGQTTTLMEKLETHKSAPVDFPDPWPANVPEPWLALLKRLLAKEPEDRFSSYTELREALVSLQPVNLPSAGRLPRAIAWLVDLGLLLALYVMTFFAMHAALVMYEMNNGTPRLSFFHFLIAIASTLIPAIGMALQTLLGTTPGKVMFQLRIVTPHGLEPPRRTLAARSLFQFLPMWLLLIGFVLSFVAPLIAAFIVGSGFMFVIADVAFAMP